MSSYQQILSSRREDRQWRDFLEDEKGPLFHKKCQSCNFFCDNRVPRYGNFDEKNCIKKQERTKKNKEDDIADKLLKKIERKLSGSSKNQ